MRYFLLFLFCVSAQAATHTAASTSYADVNAKLALCVAGDTLAIPAGTSMWTSTLVVNKAITVRGAGATLTILQNNIGSGSYRPLFNLTGSGTGRVRDIGFDGRQVAGSQGVAVSAFYWRISNCTFMNMQSSGVQNWVTTSLVDHNHFRDCWASVNAYADQYTAWTRPSSLGTTNCVVVEDNYDVKTGAFWTPVGSDGAWGARYVWRYNILSNVGLSNFDYALDAHGNQGKPFGDPSTSIAGTVSMEAYNNTFALGTANRAFVVRGGNMIHFNNTITATGGNLLSFGTVWYATEEDGYRFGSPILQTWPPYHGITNSYLWNNTFNGVQATASNFRLGNPGTTPCTNPAGCGEPWTSDGIFIQQNRDWFLTMPTTNFYRPLAYPHPRIVLENDPPIPGSFALVSPANGATSIPVTTPLSWTASSGHTEYQLLIASDYYFSDVVFDITISPGSTSYSGVPAGVLTTNSVYFWAMRARGANGVNTSSSAPWRFTTDSGGPATVPGSFALAASSYTIDEDAGSLIVTVNRVGGTDGAVGMTYGTTPGTANPGVNYTTTTGTLSWANGDAAPKTFPVPILNDGVFGSSVNFTVSISLPTGGATMGSPTNATVTINNVNPSPGPPLLPLTFLAAQAELTAPFQTNAAGEVFQPTEAGSGRLAARVHTTNAGNWRVKGLVRAPTTSNNSYLVDFNTDPPASPTAIWSIVPLTGPTGVESRYVDWLGNGTATSQFPTNVWALPAGTNTIYIRGREANTFLYQVTIEEVPSPPGTIELASSVYSVSEGGGPVIITARRINGTNGVVGISFGTANGTATAGVNYTATAGTLSWANGDSADKTISVSILNDGVHSADKTFQVSLSNPTGGALAGSPTTTTVTINNVNPPPLPTPGSIQVTVTAMSVNENVANASVSARRANGTDGIVGITYGTQPISAVPGVNYTTTTGTLTWLDGDGTDKNFNVPILNDGVYDEDLDFRVILSSPTGGATLGSPSTNVITILNVNPPPTPPVPQQIGWGTPGEQAWEGDILLFSVLRYSGTNSTIYVNYQTIAGSAIAGVHYVPLSGTLSMEEGITSATIGVQLIENSMYDVNKYFTIQLSAPVNCSIFGPTDALGVIVEDDNPPDRGPMKIRSGRYHKLIIGTSP